MILLPAIDILDGKTVRLAQGEFDTAIVYDPDPLDAARRWVAEGARALHVVDLDGAQRGVPANLNHVARITGELHVPVQVGGGLRTPTAVADAISAGAARVVLGTAAFGDVDFLDAVIERYGDQVVVSVDAREGNFAASGWTEQTEVPAESVIERVRARGVRRFIYSSIDRDGMLSGPDLDEVARIARSVHASLTYSGGVSNLADLEALAGLRQVNLVGVIVGKALYEARFTVAEGQEALSRGALRS